MDNFRNCPGPPENLTLNFGLFQKPHLWKKVTKRENFFTEISEERSQHTMVAYKSDLYVFGGVGRDALNALLKFDMKRMKWVQVSARQIPAVKYHHSAVVYGDSMFIFGGYTSDTYSKSISTNKNGLFEYNFTNNTWELWHCFGKAPAPRSAHGAVVYDDNMWIFAGYDGNSRLNDMWAISLKEKLHVWRKITQNGNCPPTCCNFPLVVARDSMFLFSGQTGAKITNCLFQFRFKDFTWKSISTDHILRHQLSPPERCFGHTMVAHDRHLYIFGGVGDEILPNDLHCFDLDTETWSIVIPHPESEIPSGRFFHTAALIGDIMYIFGGSVENIVSTSDLYEFHISSYPNCTLQEDFGKLLKSKTFCDMEFIVGPEGNKMEAHLALVTARSTYLAEEIRRQQQSIEDNEIIQIRLPEAVPLAFEMVLNFIYTDEIDPTKLIQDPLSEIVWVIMEVYRLACEFRMKLLEQLCVQYLENTITHKNVLSAFHYASNLKLSFIKEYCLKFIVKESSFSQIVMQNEFESLEKELMVAIINGCRRKQARKIDFPVEKYSEPPGTSLKEDMEAYLKNGNQEFCDIILKVENSQIPAHKAILAARSTYFEAMFRSFMPVDKIINVQIGEIIPSRESVDSLLRYIYYGEVNMPPEDSLYLFSAPYFYGFTNTRLNVFCKQNLETNFSIEHVLPILEAADNMSALDIKNYAKKLIAQNFPKVIKLPKIKALSKPLLLEIMEELALNMTASD